MGVRVATAAAATSPATKRATTPCVKRRSAAVTTKDGPHTQSRGARQRDLRRHESPDRLIGSTFAPGSWCIHESRARFHVKHPRGSGPRRRHAARDARDRERGSGQSHAFCPSRQRHTRTSAGLPDARTVGDLVPNRALAVLLVVDRSPAVVLGRETRDISHRFIARALTGCSTDTTRPPQPGPASMELACRVRPDEVPRRLRTTLAIGARSQPRGRDGPNAPADRPRTTRAAPAGSACSNRAPPMSLAQSTQPSTPPAPRTPHARCFT